MSENIALREAIEDAAQLHEEVALLNTSVELLKVENAALEELLGKQRTAYEDFVGDMLGMFTEQYMKAFNAWVDNINKAIGALPGEPRDGLGGAK